MKVNTNYVDKNFVKICKIVYTSIKFKNIFKWLKYLMNLIAVNFVFVIFPCSAPVIQI